MIIQCTECQTRFKLADDKMKPAGVRVRCTNCNEVFTALAPAAVVAPSTPAKPSSPDKQADEAPDTADFSEQHLAAEQSRTTPESTGQDSSDQEFDFGEFNMEDLDDSTDEQAEASHLLDSRAASLEEESELDIPDFSLDDESDDQVGTEPGGNESGDLPPLDDFNLDDEEFTGFDSDETGDSDAANAVFSLDDGLTIGGDLGVTFEDESPDEALPELDRTALGTQEFTFDDSPDEPLVESASSEPAGPVEFSFDSDEDPFTISDEPAPESEESPASDDFIFEERAEKGSPEPQPAAQPRQEHRPKEVQTPGTESPRDSLPAQPPQRRLRKQKTKRRKKSSGYRSAMLFVLLLLVIAAGYGYFGWQQGTYAPAILIERAQLMIMGTVSTETNGQIDLMDLRSQFVVNQSAGTLFVVHGKAVNNFSDARSTISVRGIIYDDSGKAVLQQTAFCGNSLDEAALRTMPYAKIEETMNNQFGDSLSNLNIDPGQSIPFSIVFRNIPSEVAEFNIELADSRPGTK